MNSVALSYYQFIINWMGMKLIKGTKLHCIHYLIVGHFYLILLYNIGRHLSLTIILNSSEILFIDFGVFYFMDLIVSSVQIVCQLDVYIASLLFLCEYFFFLCYKLITWARLQVWRIRSQFFILGFISKMVLESKMKNWTIFLCLINEVLFN